MSDTTSLGGTAGGEGVARRARPGELAVKLGLLVGATLVALLVGEAVARVVARVKGVDFTLYMQELSNSDRLPRRLQVFHPMLRWALNPGEQVLATTSEFSVFYRVNASGFRDQEYPLAKPPGKVRAVALGDSLTFGEGISYGERYTDIAEAALPNLEILTMAVPGYGLDQMLLTFVQEGVKFRPDVVILCLGTTVLSRHALGPYWLEGAPIGDMASWSLSAGGRGATLYRRERDPDLRGNASFVLRHSYLISYLHYKLTLRRLRLRLAQEDLIQWGARLADDTVPEPQDAEAAKQAAYLQRGLERLSALAKEHKFRIIVLNIDPNLVINLPPSGLPDGPEVVFLDFSADLRAEAAKRSLRFRYDPHYNPETNRFLGDLLAAALRRNIAELRK